MREQRRRDVGRSVLLVDRDLLLRQLLAAALEGHGFVVDTAACPADAMQSFARKDHDAVILEVELGFDQDGFELAERLRGLSEHVPIIFLTNVPDARFAERDPSDLPAGVAYVRKAKLAGIQTLIEAIDATVRGVPSQIVRHDRDPTRPLGNLTRKQIAVLRLAAEGLSNQQIADARGVSVKAVEDTISRATRALDIDAVRYGNLRVAAVGRYLAGTAGLNSR